MTVYPEVLRSLRDLCHRYRQGLVDIDELKAGIWSAAGQIVHVEERALREFLQSADGKLDMMQFTVDEASVFGESLKIVSAIERKLEEAMQ